VVFRLGLGFSLGHLGGARSVVDGDLGEIERATPMERDL
jgi:hypothetical protein